MPPGGLIPSQMQQSAPEQASEGPVPDTFESFSLGMEQMGADRIGATYDANHNEWMELARALGEANGKGYDYYLPARGYGQERQIGRGVLKDKLWGDLESYRKSNPGSFRSTPTSKEQFESNFTERRNTRLHKVDQRSARAGGLAHFAGSIVATAGDPINLVTLPLGGGGKTLAQVALRTAATNAVVETISQPIVKRERLARGSDLTLGEAVGNVGAAFAFGGILGGGGKFIGDRYGGTIGSGWSKVKAAPKAVQEKAWATILERTPGLAKKVGKKVDWDALDDQLPDIAEAMAPSGGLTDLERGAINFARSNQTIDAANPFYRDGPGEAEHHRLLGETMQGILDDAPAYVPKLKTTKARLRGTTSTASGVTPNAPPVRGGGGNAPSDLNSALTFILELEGGSKVITDSGGLTKYGISAKGNPGVNIRNLSEAAARDIYKSKYAAPLGLEKYSPDVALIALDAKINHRGGFAEKLLREAGNNPAQMLAMRRSEYARLIRDKPGKYKRYKRGWENRLRKIEGRLGMRAGAPASGQSSSPSPAAPSTSTEPRFRPDGSEEDFRAQLDREMADTQNQIADIDRQLDEGLPSIVDEMADAMPSRVEANADLSAPIENIDPAPRINTPEPAANEIAGLTDQARTIMPALRNVVDVERDVKLNDPAGLANRFGVNEQDVQVALQQMAVDGLVVQGRRGGYRRLPQRKDAPEDILTFVAARGGLADNEGHDLGTIFQVERQVNWKRRPDANGQGGERLAQPYRTTRPAFIPGHGPLVRKGKGQSVDRMAESAWEAGWFGPPEMTPRPTTSEFIELLQNSYSSGKKVYRPHEAPTGAPHEQPILADKNNPFLSSFQSEEHYQFELRQFDAAANDLGLALDEESFAHAWRIYEDAGDGDIGRAITSAINREIDDYQARLINERGMSNAADIIDEWDAQLQSGGKAGEAGHSGQDPQPRATRAGNKAGQSAGREEAGPLDPEVWQQWDDPSGVTAKAATDSLEHDLRAAHPTAKPDGPDADVDPNLATREQQETQLRAEAPLKGENVTGQAQDGTMGSPLFDAADQPTFRLEDEGDSVAVGDLLDEFDQDSNFLTTIRDCL